MKRKVVISLAILSALGALLRLILINSGLDVDDASTVFVSGSASPSELIERVRLYEFSPPLYFAIMAVWTKIFGDSAVSIVIPSMILASGLIPCVYVFARELFEREDIAMTSAFFAAVSPLAAIYSREARSSTVFVVLATLGGYYLIKCLKATRRARLIGLFLTTVLMLYSSYLGLIMVALMVLNTVAYLMFPFKSALFKPKLILATLFGALSVFLPWSPVFIEQSRAAGFWSNQESMSNFYSILTSGVAATLPLPWNASYVLLMFLLPIIAIVVIWKTARLALRRDLINFVDHRKAHAYLITNMMIPILGYSYLTPLVGSQRYLMSYIVCGWILWAALSVEALSEMSIRLAGRSPLRRRLALTVIGATLLIVSVVEIKESSYGDCSGLRRLASDLERNGLEGTALIVAPGFNAYTLRYYMMLKNDTKASETPCLCLAFPGQTCDSPVPLKAFADALSDANCVQDALQWISKVDVGKAQKLLFVNDETVPFGKPGLARERSYELLNSVKNRYELIEPVRPYPSRGRSFSVYSFKLSDPPD